MHILLSVKQNNFHSLKFSFTERIYLYISTNTVRILLGLFYLSTVFFFIITMIMIEREIPIRPVYIIGLK